MSPEDVTMSPTTEAGRVLLDFIAPKMDPVEFDTEEELRNHDLMREATTHDILAIEAEAAAPLQATVARLTEALDDAGRTFRRITGSPETDLVLYARDVAQWADDATNDVDAALSDTADSERHNAAVREALLARLPEALAHRKRRHGSGDDASEGWGEPTLEEVRLALLSTPDQAEGQPAHSPRASTGRPWSSPEPAQPKEGTR